MNNRRCAVILVILLTPLLLWSQKRIPAKPLNGDYIGIEADFGLTKFYGDIDDGAAQGELFPNNMAYQFQVLKNFYSIFELGGRVSFGGLSGEKVRSNSNQYFKARFIEYSADASVNLLAFIMSPEQRKFSLYGKIGLGLIDFKTKLYDGVNDSIVKYYGYDDQKATTEMVIPIGIKLMYHLTPSTAISAIASTNRVNTDKLDTNTGNNNSDYYFFVSVGFCYKLDLDRIGVNKSKKRKSIHRDQRKSHENPSHRN